MLHYALIASFLTLSFTSIIGMPQSALAASGDILGAPSVKTYSAQKLPRWGAIQQSTLNARFNATDKAFEDWDGFITKAKNDPPLRKMMKTNVFVNKFAYKQDNWVYDQDDYWASPAEMFKNGGDCEDFAITKYFTLRQMGFDASAMKIAMVYDVYSGTDHAFLIVTHNKVDYVLDNREKMVVARYMKNRYRPHYAFNEKTVWVYDSPQMVQKMRHDDGSIIAGNR